MTRKSGICLLAALASSAVAWPTQSGLATGTGPYASHYFEDPSLVNHTIYMPRMPPKHEGLPVLLWAQGGCDNNGSKVASFLTNIASYGFIVLADGPINGSGDMVENPDYFEQSLDWIGEAAGKHGKYQNVDIKKIAAAGHSCGGLIAYTVRDDPRVSHIGIFSSGFLETVPEGALPDNIPVEPPSTIAEVHKPVFYFVGGPNDVAYPQATTDYAGLTGVPKWFGSIPVGHSGTFQQPNGGADGVAAVNWLTWIFKGSQTGGNWFIKGGAEAAGWNETRSSGLDMLLSYTHW